VTIGAGAGFCGARGTGAMMGLARGAVSGAGAGAGGAARTAGSASRAEVAVADGPAKVGEMVAGAAGVFEGALSDEAFSDGAFSKGAFSNGAFFDGAFFDGGEVRACGCGFMVCASREMEVEVAARVSAG
jgi:hypothetical protein